MNTAEKWDHDEAIELFGLFHTYIKYETSNVNVRVKWFLQSQAFLIAAYPFAFKLLFDNVLLTLPNSGAVSRSSLALPASSVCLVMLLISYVGMRSSWICRVLIEDALSVIMELDRVGSQVLGNCIREGAIPKLLYGPLNGEIVIMNKRSFIKPAFMLGLWAIAALIPIIMSTIRMFNF